MTTTAFRFLAFAAAVVLWAPAATWGAGAAHSPNFIVLAPDKGLAEEVLAQAERFRAEVAKELLGKPLAPGIGPTIIHIELSDTEARGMTWAIDHPDRKYHTVWLVTDRENSLRGTLRHEITHVVLATQFPSRLPKWAEEGAASLSDDDARADKRKNVIDSYIETGNWPDVARSLRAQFIDSSDVAAYGVATSVTEYLISRADKRTFIAFAAASREDLNKALYTHFGLRDVRELQSRWEGWATERSLIAAAQLDPNTKPSRSIY